MAVGCIPQREGYEWPQISSKPCPGTWELYLQYEEVLGGWDDWNSSKGRVLYPTAHITNLTLLGHRGTREIVPHSRLRRTIMLPWSWSKASRLHVLDSPVLRTQPGLHPRNTNSPQEETRDGQQGWLESRMGRPGQTRPLSVHLLYLSLAVFHSVVVFECMRICSVMYDYIPCWMRQNRPDRPECGHKMKWK